MTKFKCYYCKFETYDEKEYLKHGALNHLYKPLFPNETELRTLELEPQRQRWEYPLKTEKEAWDSLRDWVGKRLKEGKIWQRKEVDTMFHYGMPYGKQRTLHPKDPDQGIFDE
jgi:hypothetical protein